MIPSPDIARSLLSCVFFSFSLCLDDEPIGNEERPTIYDSNVDDNSLAVQNASRILDWTDNGKVLRCVASHIALDRPKETTMQLQVYCKRNSFASTMAVVRNLLEKKINEIRFLPMFCKCARWKYYDRNLEFFLMSRCDEIELHRCRMNETI